VINHALSVDHSGIYKADVALKDGRHRGDWLRAGKPRHPATTSTSIIGPGTDDHRREGRILTAAVSTANIHFIAAPSKWSGRAIAGVTPPLLAAALVRRMARSPPTCTPPMAYRAHVQANGRRGDEHRPRGQGQRKPSPVR